jgi:predicted secreted protein
MPENEYVVSKRAEQGPGVSVRMPTEYTGKHRDITVRVGEEFVIALEGNPTTGYQWEAHYDSSMLQLVDRAFSADSRGIGSGGIERFRFKAPTAGDTQLELIYKRAWETIITEDVVFHLHVTN